VAAVLRWGLSNRRDLPWRRTRDPWHILSSEVMLQQTQAHRVVEPYRRWVERFPDPNACARAGPAEALRALRIHQAAVIMVEEHDAKVPDRLALLEALPGVGPYTARAVMVFAFGAPCGVVDTNVARLLCRAVAGRRLTPSECQALADRLVPVDEPWAYNQTLFDIGVAHCRAREPRCGGCPLHDQCRWRLGGLASPDPAVPPPRQSRFDGSDRQGRGRLVDALRSGNVPAERLAVACGWRDDPTRAGRMADQLVRDGMARWQADGSLGLP
jgi:A/G-specific adenine glycosylase